MKTSTKAYALTLTASALMMLGVFSKPLGMPANSDALCILLAAVLMWFGFRLTRKAKEEGQIPAISDSQRPKRFWQAVIVCGIVCVLGPLWLPLTGTAFPLWKLVIISIISFICSLGAIFLGLKMNSK